jgi:hypothetical protein
MTCSAQLKHSGCPGDRPRMSTSLWAQWEEDLEVHRPGFPFPLARPRPPRFLSDCEAEDDSLFHNQTTDRSTHNLTNRTYVLELI